MVGPDVQAAPEAENYHTYCGNDSPDPVELVCFHGVHSSLHVLCKRDDRMQKDLDCEDSSHPSVKDQVGRVGPVREPQQNVVSAGEQEQQRQEYVCENTSPAKHV